MSPCQLKKTTKKGMYVGNNLGQNPEQKQKYLWKRKRNEAVEFRFSQQFNARNFCMLVYSQSFQLTIIAKIRKLSSSKQGKNSLDQTLTLPLCHSPHRSQQGFRQPSLICNIKLTSALETISGLPLLFFPGKKMAK